MSKVFNQLPNAITCLNVLSGTIAIIMAARGTVPCGPLTGLEWAYVFIGIAAVADFCDGLAARLLHAYSNLGKELDSLCDLVSFGVAPAMITHYALEAAGAHQWVTWLPVLIPVFAALRLAKFNIDTRQTTSFLGLPVPANAIFWIGYSAAIVSSPTFMASARMTIIWVAVMCMWMVSETPLFSLKIKSLKPRESWRQFTLIIAAAVLVFCLGVEGLMWLIIFYGLFGRITSKKA